MESVGTGTTETSINWYQNGVLVGTTVVERTAAQTNSGGPGGLMGMALASLAGQVPDNSAAAKTTTVELYDRPTSPEDTQKGKWYMLSC